jgi:hypothetical protein
MDPIYEAYITEASKVEVFRLEHKVQKLGPYHAGYKQGGDFAKQFPVQLKYNPDPSKDPAFTTDILKNGVFGFSSLFDMKRWFTSKGIRFLLDTDEFHVIKKSVPADAVVCGNAQCVVDRKKWEKVPSKTVKF